MARSTSEISRITWPGNKSFAFTIVDDTDGATVKNVGPIYQLLKELRFRTTKTAWPLASEGAEWWHGDSCAVPEYLNWLKQLRTDGFEIGYHLASSLSSDRQQTEKGIERFKELFDEPQVAANHSENREGMYWGAARLSGFARLMYRLLMRFRGSAYEGHVAGSAYFWGDICAREITFYRNFVFADINTLKKCPFMPYWDASRPFVQSWFASSDGVDADRFCRLLSPTNQQRLEKEGGACIVYTHFARGFMVDDKLRADFRMLMTELSRRNGWYVPAGQLIRYLRDQHDGVHALTVSERRRLEWSWLSDKLLLGRS